MRNRAWLGLVGAAALLAWLCGFAVRGCAKLNGDGSATVTVVSTITASPTASPEDPTVPPEPPHSPSPSPPIDADSGMDPGAGVGHSGSIAGSGLTFGISGDVTSILEPGVTAPINLILANPYPRPLQIEDLAIAIGSITAPRASATFPCTLADFSVTQAQGASGLLIPPSSSASLEDLGLAPSQLPTLTMVNSAVNQEGCKEATVTLIYGGSAYWGDL